MADHQREMVFCHECENEWYRDEHGLACPDCRSEFIEIIEAEHDPRDDHLNNHDDELEDLTANPWTAPDPDESVPNMPAGFHLQRNGPNSYAITGTWSTTFGGPGNNPGGQPPANPLNPLLRNFTSMMQGITGATAPRSPPHGEQHEDQHQEGHTEPGAAREETRHGAGPRYTYTSTARLFPRDANSPGPHVPPTDDLHHVIAGILGGGAFGPPGFTHGEGPRYDDPFSPGGGGGGGMPRGNPLATLFASILNPQLAAHGDAVYTQEALDRVISQLMDQNATGNAPGPASAEAIAALPRKVVTRKMVGADAPEDWPEDQLKGECSICMDEVPIGETVTELPCSHWFHGACIEAWLKEHDTCPHCRKGIEKKEEGQGNGGPGNNGSPRPFGGSGSGAGGFGSPSPGAGPSGNDGGFDSGGFGSGSGNNDFQTGNMPNIPGGWQAATAPTPEMRPDLSPLARALILAIQNLEPAHRGDGGAQIAFVGPAQYAHYQNLHQPNYGADEDFILLRHIVRSRDLHQPQPRQRRRSSLRGWVAGGMGFGSSSGGDEFSNRERPGLGERIRRSLFGGASTT
ncbi:uncharacterized protein K452DRAFT_172908 [Aplosporella prunicola CBS 121167]|uniref:RING-type E3 ubiquitin transferase n=1 Tax=Aplosporella prunicola CBS 121167 TaxID=1176127 RepID=A0A6A6AU81_9PEZI|nr:uncharacterized protein K452DRAFT_172908 [Aplosporella prunicola CBS 121167]KAF2135562.1 hypothetical protein K452DRAFT_172908 [Aplosporella prunicola CBS 121167]